jgi:hypothetical protein
MESRAINERQLISNVSWRVRARECTLMKALMIAR